jgi:hypothetical protein
MSDRGRPLLVGLGVVVAAAVAIGYGLIAGGIATPLRGDRAVLDVPAPGTASPAMLGDGRPVFAVNDRAGGLSVLDAQQPPSGGRLGRLIAWCPDSEIFVSPGDGSRYASSGELLDGPAEGGLVEFAIRPEAEDPGRIIVGSDSERRGEASPRPTTPFTTCASGLVVHEPPPSRTFDPSVAADQEPPGWIWLEGTVRTIDDEVRLCDGIDSGCDGYAATVGIDPATARRDAEGVAGSFIGRVRDGAIEGLAHVPASTEVP